MENHSTMTWQQELFFFNINPSNFLVAIEIPSFVIYG